MKDAEGSEAHKPISEEVFDALFRSRVGAYAGLPGPAPSFPLGNAAAFLERSADVVCAEWGTQYGGATLIWLGPTPGLLIAAPDLIEQVLETRFDDFYKDAPRKALLPIITDASEFIANGEPWKQKRESDPARAAFRGGGIPTFNVGAVRGAVRDAAARYVAETSAAPFPDATPRIMRLAFDAFAVQSVGRLLEESDYDAFVEMMDAGSKRMTAFFTTSFLADLPAIVGRERWHATFEALVATAMKTPGEGEGILQAALRQGTTLDPKALAYQIGNVFFGGLISVASAVTSALYELTHSPAVAERVTAEVRALARATPDYSLAALAACPELDRVVLETLRLRTPVTFFTRNTVKTREVTFAGYPWPADSSIFITSAPLHLSKDHWPDPHRFDPDRWVGAVLADNPPGSGWFMPFGRGPRTCAGQEIAIADIKLILAEILTVSTPEVGAGQAYQTDFQFGVTLPKGLTARFS
jgi:cytochrome P450